jgi:hypothetical protein
LVNHHFGSKAVLVERLAADAQSGFVAQFPPTEPAGEVDLLVRIAVVYLEAVSRDTIRLGAFFVMWGAALPGDALPRPAFVSDDALFRSEMCERFIRAALLPDR